MLGTWGEDAWRGPGGADGGGGGARRQRGDRPGRDHRAGGRKGQDRVCGVAPRVPPDSGSVGTEGAGVAWWGAMAHLGEQAVGSGRRDGCSRHSDASWLTRFWGVEARGTLGRGAQAVLLASPARSPSRRPRAPDPAGSSGTVPGEGERLRTPRDRWLPESSGGAGAQGQGDGSTAHQGPSRGGSGAPAQVRTRPGEGLVRRRGCCPCPGPGPFPWLKVVKVRRCVRVRRNLLVLPSSTRRVNAFVGDSAFWEHRSPSHLLPSPGHP